MSQENLEIVRRFFKAVERALQTRRGAMLDAVTAGDIPPDAAEAFGYMHPEAEWNPAFSGETYHGLLGLAKGWDELLEAAESYSLELLDVSELGGDRVLAVFGPSLQGKSSGIQVNAAIFAVVTLEDSLITQLDEYTSLREALAAAGLSE